MSKEPEKKRTVEIISLIYKSPLYLNSIVEELKKTIEFHKADPYFDVSARIVGCDPTETIEKMLPECGLSYSVYRSHNPDDYYINRIYSCFNQAGFGSEAEIICFVNSDFIFGDKWLMNLLKHYKDGTNIPCSRLIERCSTLKPGPHAIKKHLGDSPKDFNWEKFKVLCEVVSEDKTESGGLYMPCLLNRDRFIELGGFAEGNLYRKGEGRTDSQFVVASDCWFFWFMVHNYKMSHITVYDSLVYHFQEAEKNSDE